MTMTWHATWVVNVPHQHR